MSFLVSLALEYWPILAGAFGLVAAFLMGGSRQKLKATNRKAKADAKTHDRISKVAPRDPIDRTSVDAGLHEHIK